MKMKTLSLIITLAAILLVVAIPALWAGSTRSVSVSCVIEPRISVQMGQNQETETSTQGSLLEQKQSKKTNLTSPYASIIIYSYCAR